MAHNAKEEDFTTIEKCWRVVNHTVRHVVFFFARCAASVRARHTCAVLNKPLDCSFRCIISTR